MPGAPATRSASKARSATPDSIDRDRQRVVEQAVAAKAAVVHPLQGQLLDRRPLLVGVEPDVAVEDPVGPGDRLLAQVDRLGAREAVRERAQALLELAAVERPEPRSTAERSAAPGPGTPRAAPARPSPAAPRARRCRPPRSPRTLRAPLATRASRRSIARVEPRRRRARRCRSAPRSGSRPGGRRRRSGRRRRGRGWRPRRRGPSRPAPSSRARATISRAPRGRRGRRSRGS